MGFPVNISVIVPFYNVEAYIEQCVESVLTTDLTIELILVDDGSTDRSAEIAERYVRSHSNVRLVHQPHSGPSDARNLGLDVARGEYVAFIDSDDWVEPGALTRLYACATLGQADMVMGRMLSYSASRTYAIVESLPDSLADRVASGPECFIALMEAQVYYPMACSYIYRREWIEQCGLRFDQGIIHEDELWTQMALCYASKVAFVYDTPFYYYRQRQGSIMHTFAPQDRIRSLFHITDRMVRFAERYSFDDLQDWSLKSWMYVNISRLYAGIFISVAQTTDSAILLPAHYLRLLEEANDRMHPEAGKLCAENCQIARANEAAYEKWRDMPWNRFLASLSPGELQERKIILFYNNAKWHNEDLRQWDHLPNNFVVTDDRRYYGQAYAVVFDLTSLAASMQNELEKPAHQLWINWSMECEENYPILKNEYVLSLFDIHVGYHQDSDVVCPYYGDFTPSLIPAQIDLSARERNVCMFISSRLNHSRRQQYLKELMQYIDIESFGALYQNMELEKDQGWVTKHATYVRYRFVIAFENAIAKDYVTEKFYDPLLAGAVPIYLGAPNVDDYAPGDNCYINVADFDSPKELALYLKRCLTDEDEYLKYHRWRNEPWRKEFLDKVRTQQETSVLVRVCRQIDRINQGAL